MESFFSPSFSHIGIRIIENLDYPSIFHCKLVNKSWLHFIESERALWQHEVNLYKKKCQNLIQKAEKDVQESKKENTIGYSKSDKLRDLKSLLESLKTLETRDKSWNNLKTVTLLMRRLVIPKEDVYLADQFLQQLLPIKSQDLIEVILEKEPFRYQYQLNWNRSQIEKLQSRTAWRNNIELYTMFANLVGNFNPKIQHCHGETVLHEMIKYYEDHEAIIDFIIDHTTDLDSTNINRDTPLHVAAYRGNFDIFKKLLSKIKETDARDLYGNLALTVFLVRHYPDLSQDQKDYFKKVIQGMQSLKASDLIAFFAKYDLEELHFSMYNQLNREEKAKFLEDLKKEELLIEKYQMIANFSKGSKNKCKLI